MVSNELLDELRYFLARVGDNYVELSHDKVRDEYLYFKKRGKELKWALEEELGNVV